MTTGVLELHGKLEEWLDIRQFLLENEDSSSKEPVQDDWSMDWGWKDEDTSSKKSKNTSDKEETSPEDRPNDKNESWLNECVLASSPMGDVFAVGKDTKAVFLTGDWDPQVSRMRFSVTFQGILSQEIGESITTMACIPLVSKKMSSTGNPDWTCLVVGFSSGTVRIYTENGSILIGQLFHNQPVQSFKVRSYIPARSAQEHDQLEELIVIYQTVIVTMDGFGLFQTLRACRNHLARLKANAADSMVDPPPLTYKKWGYEKDGLINDCEAFGLNTPSTFDHLFNGSILGGFDAKCSPVPQTSNIFVSSGKNPYLAFHYAQEGQATPLLTEIAFAVASKLKSSLLNAASGWLGFGGTTSTSKSSSPAVKDKPKIEPATLMSCRCYLPDNPRFGKCIIMSPCRKLSVVTDSLGRIILLDNERGISVRMWKGYRDSQCSWLQVDEEVSSRSSRGKEPRRATFLVIYAPRRGNLEVFAMQQGPKVATFNVSRTGRLLSTTFGMMGLNNIPIRTGNRPAVQTMFIDNEARLYTLRIPFHLALCDRTSSKVKDMHLLKALQRLLREDGYKEADILEILNGIRMQTMINQAFRLLSQKCRKVDVLVNVLNSYLDKFCDDGEKDLSIVMRMQSLLVLYCSLIQSTESPPVYDTPKEGAEKTILHCLHAAEREMQALEDMAAETLPTKPSVKSVTFGSNEEFLNVNAFFSTLQIEFDAARAKASSKDKDSHIKINFKSEHLHSLGTLLVCGCLNNSSNLAEWGKNLRNAGLIPSELLVLALEFWTQKALVSSSYAAVMERLYHVVTALCKLEGYNLVTNEFGRVSKWWEDIRREIMRSSKIFHVYSFAIVCRGVAIDLQQKLELESPKSKDSEKPQVTVNDDDMGALESDGQGTSKDLTGLEGAELCDADWENMSLDLLKWNLLLKQFEDLFLLTAILNQKPVLKEPVLPVLNNTIESISVIQLLDKGKGCIAELVGKWLTTIGVDPALIVDDEWSTDEITKPDKIVGEVPDENESNQEAGANDEGVHSVLELLKSLRKNFSVSLSSSIILANYCWEYCLEWNKETNNVIYLEAATKCATAITSPYVRQGMMSMMWTTFVVKKFSPLVPSSKIGRDKLMEKTSGFTNPEIKQTFLKSCVSFLDLFMDANARCEGVTPPPQNRRTRSHWSSAAASAALTDLALIQPHANYEMILLHYQLALCTQFVNVFRIRRSPMKPLNFFDTKSRNLMFQSMSTPAPFTHLEVDLALKNLREEFLCLVISGAIKDIPEELTDSPVKPKGELVKITPSFDGVKICEQWIHKCFELARIWSLDLDGMRINQVCEFYSSGLDSMGQEAIASVSSRDILGARLLTISGMRVSYLIQRSTGNYTEIMASFSTNFTNWLDSLEYSNLRCLRFPKDSIVELAQQIMQLIPESSYDSKLAEEVLHAIDYI